MNEKQFAVFFPSFGPIHIWESTPENAVIRAKFQRLEEKLSTDVVQVMKKVGKSAWQDCGITDFPELQRTAA